MNNPIHNKVIISTHAKSDNDTLSDLLINAGAQYFHIPLIQIQQNELSVEEQKNIENVNKFDNIIFTSKNGVKYFFKYITEFKINLKPEISFIVIGKGTQKELNKYGYSPKYTNQGNDSIAFSLNLKNIITQNQKSLTVMGTLAPNRIPDSINQYSSAQRINIYKTKKVSYNNHPVKDIINNYKFDLILFSSPSAFNNFIDEFPNIELNKLKAGCIGTITADSILKKHTQPLFIAEQSDNKGLFDATINYFNKI